MAPLSKSELLKETLKYQETVNKFLGEKFYDVSEEKIKENIENKYDIYLKATKYNEDFEYKKTAYNHLNNNKPNSTELRHIEIDSLDYSGTPEGENKNEEFINNLLSGTKYESHTKQLQYVYNTVGKNIDIQELVNASKSFEAALEFSTKNPGKALAAWSVDSIVKNLENTTSRVVGNFDILSSSISNWKLPLEHYGSKIKSRINFYSHPASFLYEEKELDNCDDFENIRKKLGEMPVQIDNSMMAEYANISSDNAKFAGVFNTKENEKYSSLEVGLKNNNIHNDYLKYKLIFDKDKKFVEAKPISKEESDRLDDLSSLLDKGPVDSAKFMTDKLDYYKSFFPNKNNNYKKISSEELSKVVDQVRNFSRLHKLRKKPSFFAFFFRTQSAKDYKKERKAIDTYCDFLKENGLTDDMINSINGKGKYKSIKSSELDRITKSINDKNKEFRNNLNENADLKDNDKKEFIIDEVNDKDKVISVNKNNLSSSNNKKLEAENNHLFS